MNDMQIFQILGLIFFLVGISGLIDKNILNKLIDYYAESVGITYLSGLLTVFLGYIMIAFHNDWNMNISVIITIIGWLTFIKGVVLVLFTDWSMTQVKQFAQFKSVISASPLVITVIGIIFLILGYVSI